MLKKLIYFLKLKFFHGNIIINHIFNQKLKKNLIKKITNKIKKITMNHN